MVSLQYNVPQEWTTIGKQAAHQDSNQAQAFFREV